MLYGEEQNKEEYVYKIQTAYIYDENSNMFEIGNLCEITLKDETKAAGKIINIENNDGDSWVTIDCSKEYESNTAMINIEDISNMMIIE